jgi:hypothetical protein
VNTEFVFFVIPWLIGVLVMLGLTGYAVGSFLAMLVNQLRGR